jgi:Uma2 family endonuclease
MRPEAQRTMSVEEYFRFDESSPLKHEYVRGEVYALSGVTLRHDRIARNVLIALSAAAGDGPGEAFSSHVRLRVSDDLYYYPDVTLVWGQVAELDVMVTDPCVIVEVTSPSTARIDRGEKLAEYRAIPSLRAYLIVDHRRRRVERHWRDAGAAPWRREEVVGEGRAAIPCLDVELTLDEIYRRVELPAVGEPEAEYDL